jgi:hypothetical protein
VRRVLPAVALALGLAAPASAKELVALSVCGTDGCHTTTDRRELRSAIEVQPQATPEHGGPFYRVRGVVGEPGEHDPGTIRSQWIPSLRLLRHEDGTITEFSQPYPDTERTLNRLSTGLTPFAAGAKRDDDGGAAWALSALAILPAGLVFVMRRRGRWK